MECVVLAGGRPRPGDSLWPQAGGRPKAMIEIAGRPMIAWVLDALRSSRHIDRLIVVGLDANADLPRDVEAVADQGDLVGNLYAGIARLSEASPAAYCWSDIPLAAAPMFDRYIEATTDPELDVNAGLVPKTLLQTRYPETEDLWLRLAEGSFIAADFGLFHPRHAARLRPQIERLAPQRKHAWRQALSVGLPLLVRFATGRLSIPVLVGHLERRFEMRCGVRVVSDPELGLDVDTAGGLELCRRVLAKRQA